MPPVYIWTSLQTGYRCHFFLTVGGGALVIAAITLSMHAIKAARQNPVTALRHE